MNTSRDVLSGDVFMLGWRRMRLLPSSPRARWCVVKGAVWILVQLVWLPLTLMNVVLGMARENRAPTWRFSVTFDPEPPFVTRDGREVTCPAHADPHGSWLGRVGETPIIWKRPSGESCHDISLDLVDRGRHGMAVTTYGGGHRTITAHAKRWDLASEHALVGAYQSGCVAPRWWQYWRWRERRLVHPHYERSS